MLLLIVICLIALQFSDAIASYPVFKNSLQTASSELQWLASLIGVGPAIITTKVVIVAVIVALYMLTTLPLWLWIVAIAYYLYRTGKWAFMYMLLKKYVNG
jgi:hypothetical protein